MEQRLQVCALPLSCHVEVGQLRLEGPLGKGKGCQLRELGPSCLPSPGCRCQLGRLLAQLQASAVLGLSGEGRVSTQLQPLYQDARLPEPQFPHLYNGTPGFTLPTGTLLSVTFFWRNSLTPESGLEASHLCHHSVPFLTF